MACSLVPDRGRNHTSRPAGSTIIGPHCTGPRIGVRKMSLPIGRPLVIFTAAGWRSGREWKESTSPLTRGGTTRLPGGRVGPAGCSTVNANLPPPPRDAQPRADRDDLAGGERGGGDEAAAVPSESPSIAPAWIPLLEPVTRDRANRRGGHAPERDLRLRAGQPAAGDRVDEHPAGSRPRQAGGHTQPHHDRCRHTRQPPSRSRAKLLLHRRHPRAQTRRPDVSSAGRSPFSCSCRLRSSHSALLSGKMEP